MRDWKDLYKKQKEHTQLHKGPLLFYNDLVLTHITNPRNMGVMNNPDGKVILGDPSCGDYLKIAIKVEGKRIVDIKYTSNGCNGTIATISMMTELAKGKTVEEAQKITDDEVISALGGVPERKKQCSLMGVAGLRAAIEDYLKNGLVK